MKPFSCLLQFELDLWLAEVIYVAHIAGVDCLTSMSVPVFQRRFLHRCFRTGRTGMALMLGCAKTSSRCLERIKSSGLFQCSQGELMSKLLSV